MSSAKRKFRRKVQVKNKKSTQKNLSKVMGHMKNLSGTKCSFCDKIFQMSMAADWRIDYKPESSVPIMLACNECFTDESKQESLKEAFRR
jgi:xanthine dehydrogenase iron-sulfur cluster and FAD-binding subunit A